MSASEIIVVGRFGAPFGVQGWIHCQSYTTPAENLLSYQPWFYQNRDKQWAPLEDVETKKHKKSFIAKIPSHPAREDVALLRGLYVGIEATSLPAAPSDEVYWRDLVGCEVVNSNGPLGKVKSVMETGANDVLVVALGDTETLIPYADGYVLDVDMVARRIQVAWDESWV